MEHVGTIAALRAQVARARQSGRSVALVPTMGALHAGHLALVDAARREADFIVMSVFVNPRQFAPGGDFDRYPRDLARDGALAAGRGVDLLFAPHVEEMYGRGTEIVVSAGETASRWEGAFRPGHFDGVLTVVTKLFNIVQPDLACFGRKDIQQVTMIRRLIEELDIPVRLVVVPTVRDHDGLALSSRNTYLSEDERRSALALPRALRAAVSAWHDGERDAQTLESRVAAVLHAEPAVRTDYIAVVEPDRLAPVVTAEAGTIVAVAARLGTTRLIDNTILGEQDF
jgi:pantoate--beta-alanine ligase